MRMNNRFAVGAAVLAAALSHPCGLGASPPPALPPPIALVGGNRIEEADIHRAALVMNSDPFRTKRPAEWRKMLLDLCLDRELLAMEADRRGFLAEPRVQRDIELRSAGALYMEIRDRVLLPAIEPKKAEIDTARAGHGFRRINLRYMLTVSDRKTSLEFCAALRHGASFDSIARLFSIHPSSIDGGRLGWLQLRFLNPASHHDLESAKPGDVLGPYSNDAATEVYRVDAIEEPSDADIRASLVRDRSTSLDTRYDEDLLRKYGFALDPNQVAPVIFAASTERADSIRASLGPDGTRAERGVRPALGIVARAGSDSVTYRDISEPDVLIRESDGKGRIDNTETLFQLCASAIRPRLVLRDARERGIDRDPRVVRILRLIREGASTHAMVAREVPRLSDPAPLRAFFESHRERYQRPPARRAVVAIFIREDSARATRYFWSGISDFDSSLITQRFRLQQGASLASLLPGYYAPMSLYETDRDSLSVAARTLEPGQLSPVVRLPHGFALCLVLAKEPARPLTFEEAAARVAAESHEDREDAWVVSQLERLRRSTPAKRFPARLSSMRLAAASGAEGRKR